MKQDIKIGDELTLEDDIKIKVMKPGAYERYSALGITHINGKPVLEEVDWATAPSDATHRYTHPACPPEKKWRKQVGCNWEAWIDGKWMGVIAPDEDEKYEPRPDPSTDWDGGLPPVGAAVYAKCTAKTKARDWFPAEVMYISPYTVVLRDYSTEELDGEFIAHPCTMVFSPRKTQAQIEAQERERVVTELRAKLVEWVGGEVDANYSYTLDVLRGLYDMVALQDPKP